MFYRLAGLALLALMLLPRGLRAEAEPEAYRFIGGERVQLRYEPATVGETTVQTVTDEGTLSLPSGNIVVVRGKTPFEAREAIKARLEKETTAKKISVYILLLEIPPRKIHVAGEVRKPGSIALSPGVPLSLLGALQEAGGISEKGASGARQSRAYRRRGQTHQRSSRYDETGSARQRRTWTAFTGRRHRRRPACGSLCLSRRIQPHRFGGVG